MEGEKVDVKMLAAGVRAQIRTCQELLELMINATPTSELRNKLTDVNMHLMAATGIMSEVR